MLFIGIENTKCFHFFSFSAIMTTKNIDLIPNKKMTNWYKVCFFLFIKYKIFQIDKTIWTIYIHKSIVNSYLTLYIVKSLHKVKRMQKIGIRRFMLIRLVKFNFELFNGRRRSTHSSGLSIWFIFSLRREISLVIIYGVKPWSDPHHTNNWDCHSLVSGQKIRHKHLLL